MAISMFKFLRRWRQHARSGAPEAFFDQYEAKRPQHQNAIDALPGWNSAFPVELGLEAGNHHLYADPRIEWAISQYGSLAGRKVLEVGPLEGMHTFRINKERPEVLDSVEANRLCFLRCLVTRQILNIDRSTFYLGDVQEWLLDDSRNYDMAIASGVLYHMPNPAEFLCRLAERAQSIYIWTHYFDEKVMAEGDIRRGPFSGRVETHTFAGVNVRYYERHYWAANQNKSFCGGMKDRHFWMHKQDILDLLRALGFKDIIIDGDQPDHNGGPCYSVFCRK